MKKHIFLLTSIGTILFSSCKKASHDANPPVVFEASGDINGKLNEFRSQLGALNTTTGVSGGRREVNWDGVPDAQLGIKLPNDFFNPTEPAAPVARQKGLIYAGSDDAVVSKTNFSNINANAASEFTSFSGDKSFAVVNANLWPVEFRVAGQTAAATVKGFGIVFCDVDKIGSASLEFFNESKSLGKFPVPAQSAGSKFSFLGVYFPDEKITRVRVAHEGKLSDGEKDLSNGGTKDLVVLDDFIYSEPVAK